MDDALFLGVIQFIVLLLSLSVHESAHAWSADKLGDPTARYLGRVSLNPIVHADPFGTILLPILGMFSGFMFGWAKPVPVNLSKLRNPVRDHMLVAAAGPVSNLLMALGLFLVLLMVKALSPEGDALVQNVALGGVPEGNSFWTPLAMVAFYGMVINIILAIFNLIPVAPLDGAAVLSGLLPRSMSGMLDEMQNWGIMILIALIVMDVPARFYMPPIRFVQSVLLGSY